MGEKMIWACALVILPFIGMPQLARAADIAAVYSIDSSERDGETVQGTITVTVVNTSEGNLRNVDLRLDLGGSSAITKGVLQFGRVAAGQVATATSTFRLEQGIFDEGVALPWRADYDDAGGNHNSIAVMAPRMN